MPKKKLQALDFYSGVGGWSLGLAMAGIEVLQSFERWPEANATNLANNRHAVVQADVRKLKPSSLPAVDFLVGSPPCTQFSYSNRGGNGDIDDGLIDIISFLRFVDAVRPRKWAMENVPRVASIVRQELQAGGKLFRFRHLGIRAEVIDMEEFGLPQRRRRCICGNFDFDLLASYRGHSPRLSLGEVVGALDKANVRDPTFGIELPRSAIFDHELEEPLNAEEERINAAAKSAHTVYNAMPFPDSLARSSRTVTATCTRVSRESLIIRNNRGPGFRRLSVRERASLQGFPINFQFFGETYAQKLKMVGNALPPSFAYYVAHAMLGTPPKKLPPLTSAISNFQAPSDLPKRTLPEKSGSRFPATRTFRFAIPSLRLKSGVRFELVNNLNGRLPAWGVSFYFGSSKNILTLPLGSVQYARLKKQLSIDTGSALRFELESLSSYLVRADVGRLQDVWSHRGPGGTRPFDVLDRLSAAGDACIQILARHPDQYTAGVVLRLLQVEFGANSQEVSASPKLLRNANLVLAGFLVACVANESLGGKDRLRGVTRNTRGKSASA